jgi:hypothetical protein
MHSSLFFFRAARMLRAILASDDWSGCIFLSYYMMKLKRGIFFEKWHLINCIVWSDICILLLCSYSFEEAS